MKFFPLVYKIGLKYSRLSIQFNITAALAVACIAPQTNLEACTGIKLKAVDGSIVHGRTLEFGVQVNTSIVVIPREYEFVGTTPQGDGLHYKAKYGTVGAIAFNQPAIMDGMNEKGLAVGTFYFPGFANYAKITPENQSKALSPVQFSNWIVTQFANLDELKSALENVVIAPTIDKEWGNEPPPFHYIVYEKSGRSLVIEPIDGKLVTYDNPLGVFTNSPTFDWHMTNLRNFINLTPINVPSLKVDGLVFAPFSQGSGMVGLPGDFTSPSRFVRAAIFSITATSSNDAHDSVFQLFHILNQFDIPVGLVRQDEKGVVHTDYTMISCVRNPQSLEYYFKIYEDQTIQFVDLKKFDLDAKMIKSASTEGKQKALDVSIKLKPLIPTSIKSSNP
jgi:choloylglycine hydrolase